MVQFMTDMQLFGFSVVVLNQLSVAPLGVAPKSVLRDAGGSSLAVDKLPGEMSNMKIRDDKTISYMAKRVTGQGSSGVVFQAKCLETSETVIKKVLQVPNLVLEYDPETDHRVIRDYNKMNQRMPFIYVNLYTHQELLRLENDMNALEEMYSQGEKAETSWAFTVLAYIGKLIFDIVGLIISMSWVAHIFIYLLIDPPLSSFLNEIFIKLDDVWGSILKFVLLLGAHVNMWCFRAGNRNLGRKRGNCHRRVREKTGKFGLVLEPT